MLWCRKRGEPCPYDLTTQFSEMARPMTECPDYVEEIRCDQNQCMRVCKFAGELR